MNQIQENINSLLLKCVEFYGDDFNYKKTLADNKSQIDLDNGFIAKETIKAVNNLLVEEKKIEELELLITGDESNEEILEKVKNIIDKYSE